MAVDTKKIFEMNVETIQELRLKISELKKAMEGLTIGTEEHTKVAEELMKEQKRLKAAMAGVATEADDGKKSFNALNIELARLKEAWKSATTETERANLGEKINAVKAQINGMNESIGNFQHNVGNYSQSIQDAFQKMGISVTSLTAPLKKMGVDIESIDTSVKLLIGSFKTFAGENLSALSAGFSKVTSSVSGFIKGLNGIKAAILATGLGALLVLLGELVANWDDVTDAVGRWIGVNQQAILSADQINTTIELNNNQMEFNLRLMKARGESEEALIAYQLEATNQEIMRLHAIVEENNALLDNVKWWWQRKKVVEASDAAVAEIERLEKERKKLLQDREVLKVLRERQAQIEAERESTKKHTAAVREDNDALREAERAASDAVREAERAAADAQREYEDGLKRAMDLLDEEQKKQLSALELEELQYQEKLALLEQYGLDTEILTENHLERMAELRAEQARKEYEEMEKLAAAQKKKDDEQAASYKKLMKARQEATANMASGTAGILKGLSAAMGESTKLGKGFAIAAATIDTIASAVTGFRAGMNQWADAGPMAWMAPVQAALNATAALVAGYAQVQKIQSVDTSGNAQAGGASATAVAIPNIEGLSSPMEYTRQVTTETEREEMNRDQRVYILESDIQQSNNRVKVREEETTF